MNTVFSKVSYERLSLSTVASIQVTGPTPAGSNRRNTVTIANPTALFMRKDGQVTIQAANKVNTRTLRLDGRFIILTKYNGERDFVYLV